MLQNINPEKAEIIGFLCAEGSYYDYISKYWSYDHRRNKRYFRVTRQEGIEFGNNNILLLNRFLFLLKKCYNYERRVTGVPKAKKVVIKKILVMRDLLSFTEYGYMKWRVPDDILKTKDKEIKIAFLRGFYEGDGIRPDVNKRNIITKVRFSSKNLIGLRQVSQLLKDLNIKAYLHFSSKKRKEYELGVYGEGARTFIDLTKPLKCRGNAEVK